MTKLPVNFPTDKLDIIERMQLEWFYNRYTEEFYPDYLFGHFMMAAYASIPAYLTPDLLYKIWQNFGSYEWAGKQEFIHSIAVNDVLLAPFCHEVSYELFRMEENTRLSFLKWINSEDPLWENRKPYPCAEIAEFIKKYHDRPNYAMVREGAKYREDQLMEVEVYHNPEEVVSHYLQKLKKAKSENDEKEILETINALNKATKKEEYTDYSTRNIFSTLFKKNELEMWKHVIQQNNNTFANLLEETTYDDTQRSPLLLKKDEQSYSLEISNTETQLTTQLDSLLNTRNYAIIISGSEQDQANCELFHKTLEKTGSGNRWEVELFITGFPREDFLQRLTEKINVITPADNLIVYISAFGSTLTGYGQMSNFKYPITDTEFNTLFSVINPAAFTLILDSDYEASSFWLNTDKAGYALFVSSSTAREKQDPNFGTDICAFTAYFCEVLSKYRGRISNRDLFIEIAGKQKKRENTPSPKLFSNRETYYMQFAGAGIQRTRIQHKLRLCGYLDKPGSLDWDDNVEAAFQKFSEDNKIPADVYSVTKALDAKIQSNNHEQKPIFLFVFCDSEKEHSGIAEEIDSIKALAKNSVVGNYNEIKIFQNKSLKEVTEFIKSRTSRNRIQLFYFSGFDQEGLPKFVDGALTTELWGEWFSYQDHMELVMLNTSKSGFLAEQLAQVGVGMAIGNYREFKDEEGAAFGNKLLEIIAGQKKLSDLPMQQYFMGGAESFGTSFSLFKASWKTDDLLPGSWYTEHTSDKPDFYAFFWAPELEGYPLQTQPCEKNALDFQQLVGTLSNYNLKAYDFIPAVSTGPFTRNDATAKLGELNNLKEGDCCLIYYSGVGIVGRNTNRNVDNDFFDEPLFSRETGAEPTIRTIREKLRDVMSKRGIHVFLILDFQLLVGNSITIPTFTDDPQKSLVVLESLALIVKSSEPAPRLSTDNFFYAQLKDIIQSAGGKLRYSNLSRLLELRYYQAGVKEKPVMFVASPHTLNTYIFSGIFSGKSDYKVYYDDEHEEWRINAGILNGILPSLSFMHTIFLLENGRQVSIYNTFDAYSTLLNFDEPDTENTFGAKHIQNALPKLKVGFHKTISAEMKSEFERAVKSFDIYFIDLKGNEEDTSFLIKSREQEYYLVRNSGYMGEQDDRPVFFYQRDVMEFIKQLEYIAQWQAVLELENSKSGIGVEDIGIVFEIIEGIKLDQSDQGKVPSKKETDPTNLVLHYRNTFQPAFRCKVVNKSTAASSEYYINFLYLDGPFGIVKLDRFENDILHKDQEVWAALPSDKVKSKTIQLKVERFYIENNIVEIQEYLLVIVTGQPMNLKALTQAQLDPYRKEVSRSVSLEESQESFIFPEGDWHVKKIPIRIIYDTLNFKETVEETIKNRPIVTPDDLHKNRWGGKAINNGFELSAKVEKGSIPRTFDVSLKIRHKEADPDSGDVAFLVHESFANPVEYVEFRGGEASIKLAAYEDFTAAAIIYDGTELELDLSNLNNLPENFYSENPKDKFKKNIESLIKKTPIVVPDDHHKGRWGGKDEQNGYKLTGKVSKNLIPGLFNVVLEVSGNPDKSFGQVAFLLHNSFNKPVRIKSFENNRASVRVTAYEDFTAAAITSDGTQLELDLSKISGLPQGFYAKVVNDQFKNQVDDLLKITPVVVPGDLQKNRWGGKSQNNGKTISATVSGSNNTYQVTLIVESSTQAALSGDVVFFLHDSFDEQVIYRKAVNGKAIYIVQSYEAFTAGAYTEDGTTLELDLNKQQGYPKEFYYDDAGLKTAPDQALILELGLPFLNRTTTRLAIKGFLVPLDSGFGQQPVRVLVVKGPPKSGKSYTRHYIKSLSNYYDFKFAYIDFQDLYLIDFVALFKALLYRINPDWEGQSEWQSLETQESEKASLFHLLEKQIASSNSIWYFVFDGFDQVMVPPDIEQLVRDFIEIAAGIRHTWFNDSIRVVLLGYNEDVPDFMNRVVVENIPSLTRDDIVNYFQYFLSSLQIVMEQKLLDDLVDQVEKTADSEHNFKSKNEGIGRSLMTISKELLK